MEWKISSAGSRIRRTIVRLVCSGAAGVLATVADLGSLWVLVSLAGIAPVPARVSALVLGSIVMFLGQKYFVFDARQASTLGRETVLYAIIQVVGIALTTWLFKVSLGLSPRLEPHYVLVGMAVNNLLWLFYFFPLWHFVFKTPSAVPQAQPVRVSIAPEIDGQ